MLSLVMACQPAFYEIVLEDQHNYSFQTQFALESIEVKEGKDSLVDWSALQMDLLGNSIHASQIDQMAIVRFPRLSQEAVLLGIENDSLKQSDLSGMVEFKPEEDQSAFFSEFTINGTPLIPEEEILSDLGSFLIFASKEERIASMVFFEPQSQSETSIFH